MTAEEVYDQKQRELSPGVKRELRLSKIGIINLMEQYAAQQVKQITEERDELARLISDSPLCDTVVDPTLQRAWEACTTLCEKAEFKFLFKYAQNMEKRAKDTTEERDKAVELLDESRVQLQYLDKRFPTGTTPNVLGRIETFLNSLNAGGGAGEKWQ